jgi:3-hydroxyacyl-CoA dehydrogenase
VAAGRFGRKAGRGYYDYGEGPHRPEDPPQPSRDPDWQRDASLETAVHHVALPNFEEATLVELGRDAAMTDADAKAAERYFRAAGKHVEWVGDAPGLVLGRILAQIVNEAHFAVSQGVATEEDCDTAMRLGFNWPLGPFEWAGAIEPARAVAILDALHQSLGEERYRVAPLLRRRAEARPPADSS